MSKVRKNVSIDANLARIVDERDEFNLSGFVSRCLEQHFAAGNASAPEAAALQAELEHLEQELADLTTEQERLREKRQRIEDELDDVADDEPALLDQAREKLDDTPRDPDNPAIQNWAAKLGMQPDDLVAELEVEA
jgi:predicted nuclease with TOPRIM domain